MAIVLPATESKSSSLQSSLGQGLANLLSSGVQSYQTRSDEMALQNAISSLGENASASDMLNAILNTQTYSPESKQQMFKNTLGIENFKELQRQAIAQEELKRQQLQSNIEIAQAKIAKKNQPGEISDHAKAAISGLEALDEMERISGKGNLGLLSPVTKYLSSDTARDFGYYEQLGKSLIQLAAPLKITNRQEFETYANKISDPTLRDAEREGIIKGLRSTIMKSLEAEDDPRIKELLRNMQTSQAAISQPEIASQIQGNKPPLSSFNR